VSRADAPVEHRQGPRPSLDPRAGSRKPALGRRASRARRAGARSALPLKRCRPACAAGLLNASVKPLLRGRSSFPIAFELGATSTCADHRA